MASAKHGTTEEAEYTGPAPFFYWEDFPPFVGGTNLGGAGFSPGDAGNLQVQIADDSGLTTSGLVQVINEEDNRLLASDAFCGTSETLSFPGNATLANVFVGPVGGVVGAPIFADEAPPVCAGPGTTGTITVSWS